MLLDTCALLWWTLTPDQLSKKASDSCALIAEEGAFVSSISVWEIGIKMQKGHLRMNESLEGYIERIKRLGTIEIIPIDDSIWLNTFKLDWPHRDPADRVIVATAMIKNIPIITKDKLIRDFYPNCIW